MSTAGGVVSSGGGVVRSSGNEGVVPKGVPCSGVVSLFCGAGTERSKPEI